MFQDEVTKNRHVIKSLVKLCLATSLGAAAASGAIVVVDTLIRPWPIALGMLCVSGFYLLLGAGYLVRLRMMKEPVAAASAAELALSMTPHFAVADESDVEDRGVPRERELAEV